MSALAPVMPRICGLIRLFASESDGEALGAVRALGRTLESRGASFHDLADRLEHEPEPVTCPDPLYARSGRSRPDAPPMWENLTRFGRLAWLHLALASNEILSPWESDFVISLRATTFSQPHRLQSPKQRAAMNVVIAKVWMKGVRP